MKGEILLQTAVQMGAYHLMAQSRPGLPAEAGCACGALCLLAQTSVLAGCPLVCFCCYCRWWSGPVLPCQQGFAAQMLMAGGHAGLIWHCMHIRGQETACRLLLQVSAPAKPALQQALAALQSRHCDALRSLGEMLQGAQSMLALQQEQHRAASPTLKV